MHSVLVRFYWNIVTLVFFLNIALGYFHQLNGVAARDTVVGPFEEKFTDPGLENGFLDKWPSDKYFQLFTIVSLCINKLLICSAHRF